MFPEEIFLKFKPSSLLKQERYIDIESRIVISDEKAISELIIWNGPSVLPYVSYWF